MALSRAKYKRLPDLYVQGTEVELKDGSIMWLQVLNPFERDEASHDAQIARARLTLALQQGDERDKIKAIYVQDGREVAILKISEYHANLAIGKAIDQIDSDPDWREKVEVMKRSDDILARGLEDAEQNLLASINQEYLTEILERQTSEREYQTERLEKMDDEQLFEEYVDIYLARRGADVASAEFQLTELWYGARVCDAEYDAESNSWSHEKCEQHAMRVYETKQEVRDLPEDLQMLLFTRMGELNMSVRDARFSDRQGSSSDSSPLPSEPAESTPSIPTETLVAAPGT